LAAVAVDLVATAQRAAVPDNKLRRVLYCWRWEGFVLTCVHCYVFWCASTRACLKTPVKPIICNVGIAESCITASIVF